MCRARSKYQLVLFQEEQCSFLSPFYLPEVEQLAVLVEPGSLAAVSPEVGWALVAEEAQLVAEGVLEVVVMQVVWLEVPVVRE